MADAIENSAIETLPSAAWSLGRRPMWISIVVLLVVLGGGGWFLWDQWIGGTPSADTPVDIGTVNYGRPMRGPMMAQQQDFNREGIYPVGSNVFRVKSGDYYMLLMPTESALAPLRLFYA